MKKKMSNANATFQSIKANKTAGTVNKGSSSNCGEGCMSKDSKGANIKVTPDKVIVCKS